MYFPLCIDLEDEENETDVEESDDNEQQTTDEESTSDEESQEIGSSGSPVKKPKKGKHIDLQGLFYPGRHLCSQNLDQNDHERH